MRGGPRGLHWARPSRPNQFMPGLCDTPELQKLELKATIDLLSKGQREFLILASTIEYFLIHPPFGPHDDLILLELDQKLLRDVLHQRVTVGGQPEEDAVLCTESKTYAIKSVGTSNSVFSHSPIRSLLFENPYISEEDVENGGTGRDGRKEHRTV
ncbi:hypothetical protein L3X38_012574 [Prunus dulcis]|uniref:Uncharacterized protein n=1 Tax=Prunus dulcis TaxID=3755 RepID=A0AAD4WLV3_PRUDU|nr:hypothetical protein L3X38_012574 [Prunus dulcis]